MKPEQKAEAAQEIKRIGDYVPDNMAQFEGEKVKSDTILGIDIKLMDFAVLPSKQGELELDELGNKVLRNFLVLQFERDGKLFTTTTGAAQVVARIEQMPKQYLPVMIKIIKATNPTTKRTYYTVE